MVDAYIAKAAPFAQPVLEHLRELVHKACPEVEEEIKWGFPFFMYPGHRSWPIWRPLRHIAASGCGGGRSLR